MNKEVLLGAIFVLTASLSSAAAESPTIKGNIDQAGVRHAMRMAMNPMKECYEAERKANAKLQGKVDLAFEVNDKGKIQSVGIKDSTLNNKNLHECLLGVAKNISFPQTAKGTTAIVDYPVEFGNSTKTPTTQKK